LAELDAVAATRPLAVELTDTLDAALATRLELTPRFWTRYQPVPVVRDDAALAVAERARPGLLPSSPPATLWHELARLRFACGLGLTATSARLYGRLAAALPGDVLLAELPARCRGGLAQP
jgi:hypothetical protein